MSEAKWACGGVAVGPDPAWLTLTDSLPVSKIDPMDASVMARVLGRRGGLARAKRLDREDRRRIAALGARARIESLRIARRISENCAYAAATTALAPHVRIRSVRAARGPLPDLSRHHTK